MGTLPSTTSTPSTSTSFTSTPSTTTMAPTAADVASEKTFIAIKPDGIQRGLIGEVVKRFENRGFKLVACKLMTVSKEHMEKHYADLKDKPFFGGLVSFSASGPWLAMVWQGKDAVKQGRAMMGATNPCDSAPGTIRGDFCIDTGRNVIHGSGSIDNANKEIALWFGADLNEYSLAQQAFLYE